MIKLFPLLNIDTWSESVLSRICTTLRMLCYLCIYDYMSFDEGVSHVIELVSYSHIKWERCPEVISCPGRHIKNDQREFRESWIDSTKQYVTLDIYHCRLITFWFSGRCIKCCADAFIECHNLASYLMNQCQLIINWTPENKPQRNLNQNTYFTITKTHLKLSLAKLCSFCFMYIPVKQYIMYVNYAIYHQNDS